MDTDTLRGTVAPSTVSSVATEMSIQQLEELLSPSKTAEIGTVIGLPAANQVSNCGVDITDAVGPFHPIKALVAQSTILSQSALHDIGRHMKSQCRGLPKLEKPCVQLYGRAGTNSSVITVVLSVSGQNVQFSFNRKAMPERQLGLKLAQPVQMEAGQAERVSSVNVINSKTTKLLLLLHSQKETS